MKTIIATTDFSITASNAVNYAADMAIAINADLLLLNVLQVPIAAYGEIPVVVDMQQFQDAAEKDLRELKDQLLENRKDKLTITTEVCIGNFYPELVAVCEREDPYTVVMGSQGTTAAERVMFGGHAVYAMKHLQWPVITVPAGIVFSSIKKIGLACDFENILSTTPVDEIKTLVNDFKAELHILNTEKREEYNSETVFAASILRLKLAPAGMLYHFIAGDDVDKSIMDFAEKNKIDLLIVLPKRHSLIDRVLHKSHTKQLVLHSHVPVIALHHS